MVTQKGANTHVIGIKGNFDDAQTGVKNIFGDKELEKVMNNAGFQFSSANSINIGRLVLRCILCICVCKTPCQWRDKRRRED